MITIETEICDPELASTVASVNSYLSKIARLYFVDRHIHKKELNTLKSTYIKKYSISSRHFNGIRSQVDGLVLSRQECRDAQLGSLDSRIKELNQNLDKKRAKIKVINKIIKSVEKHKQKIAAWKVSGRVKKKPKQIKSILGKDINLLQIEKNKKLFLIHQKNRKKALLESKLERINAKNSSLCFGSVSLFKKQHYLKQNGYQNHQEWLQDWQALRSSESFWLGSWEESFRNQNAQYDPFKKEMSLRLPNYFQEDFGPKLTFKVPDFPYRHEEFIDIILNPRKVINKKTGQEIDRHMPVSYRLKFKTINDQKRLFLQASFVPRPKQVEFGDRKLGAIGIDLNADHIAWCESDRFGNPIHKGSLGFDPDASSKVIEAQLGDHIASLVTFGKERNKPLVCERLNFKNKKQALKETQGSKKQRKVLSEFRYKKFFQMLKSKAEREQLKLRRVSPSFSSIIGFAKFHGYKSYSSHELAALVLARRYLRFSERPKIHGTLLGTVSIPALGEGTSIRHVWSIWSKSKQKILSQLRLNSSQGTSSGFVYNPLHPTGFNVISSKYLKVR